jgi:hypothetical protein
MSAFGGKADIAQSAMSAFDPKADMSGAAWRPYKLTLNPISLVANSCCNCVIP